MASEGRGARLPDDLLSTLAHQQNCSLAGEGHVALEEAFSAFSQNFQRTCVISQTPGDDARDGGNTGSARGAAAAIIFAASLFGVMLPLIAGTRGIDLSSHMMLLLKAFSAGIMLGLAQIHIVTDAYADLAEPPRALYNNYNVPGVFVTIGASRLLLMFFTERLTMDFISYRRSKAAQAAGGSEGGSHTSHDDHGGCFSNDEEEASSAGTTTHYSGGLHVHGGAHAHGHLCLDVIHAAHAAMPPPPTARPHDHGAAGDDCLQKPPPPASAASAGAATRGAYATAFLLEFSIMVHSIVIGLDVGLDSERSVSDLIVFTGVLCVHQFFEGIALGSCIAAIRDIVPVRSQCIMALVFSVSVSAGVGIGIGVSQVFQQGSATAAWVLGSFNGLTGGMLLYMTLVVFMAEEFSRSALEGRMRVKAEMYLMLCLGAGVMAVIGLWA